MLARLHEDARKPQGLSPISGTGPLYYQLGMKNKNASEAMMK